LAGAIRGRRGSALAGLAGESQASRAHRRKRERRPLPGMMLHQDASTHVWLAGQPAVDLGCHDGRWTMRTSAFCRRFWRPKRARPRHSGPGGGIWPAWSPAELLYRSGQPLFLHAGGGREGRPHAPDASGPGSGASGASNISRPIRRRRGAGRSASSIRCRTVWSRSSRSPGSSRMEAGDLFLRDVYIPPTMRVFR